MTFIEKYVHEEVITLIVIAVYFVLKYLIERLIKRYATVSEIIEHRTNLVIKYINILLTTSATLVLFIVWGVKAEHLFVTLSSIFAVIGVALFAQWSILSNITAGVVLFFSYPFKIGDFIRIHDKDFPIEGEIVDIKSFYVHIQTLESEIVVYPNNVILQKGVSVLKPRLKEKEFTD